MVNLLYCLTVKKSSVSVNKTERSSVISVVFDGKGDYTIGITTKWISITVVDVS